MARREARKKSTSKFLSLGGEDKDGNPNPKDFVGFYVGKRQLGNSNFGDGKLKPRNILFFVTKQDPTTPVGVYEKGDMNTFLFEVGAETTIVWKGLKRLEGKTFKQNLYSIEIDDAVGIDVSDIVLPESYSDEGDQVVTTSNDTEDEEEEAPRVPVRTVIAPATVLTVSERKAKMAALLKK